MSPTKRSQGLTQNNEEIGANATAATTCSQKVLLLKDSAASQARLHVLKLQHPRTAAPALFIATASEDPSDPTSNSTHLAELNTFDEGNRSWFVGNTVQANGSLYIATPYNPVYLILPYLIKAERNVPLEQLLVDDRYPATPTLASLVSSAQLAAVADTKGSTDLNVWKYNEEKTLAWLEGKTRKLSVRLMEKKVPTTTAQALTFVRTMDQQQTKEAYLVLAHGVLSDYLPAGVSSSLRQRLGLPDHTRAKNRATSGGAGQPQPKKPRTGANMGGPTEDYTLNSPTVEKVKTLQTAKEKALAKSAAGSKNIMSFFGKKKTKTVQEVAKLNTR